MAILDLEQTETNKVFSADIAIVGGGAVGIAMAVELARAGQDVILLEAGGLTLESRSQAIFASARSTGFKVSGLHAGRFRLLGGTTNFWGGQLVPFDPIVFEPRHWVNSRGWPIARQTLDPYYARAMSLLGMDSGEASDQEVWRRCKAKPPTFPSDLELFLTRWTKRPNFAKAFRTDLEAKSLRVLTHANVVALEPDESGRRIASIHLRTFDGRRAKVSAQRTILACGTVEIARLLLLPFADGRTTPWAGCPWLGCGYIDHLDTTAGEVVPVSKEKCRDLFENVFLDGYKFQPKLKLSEAAQRERELVGVAGAFLFKTSYQEHAEQLKLLLRSLMDGRLPPSLWKLPAHAAALSRVVIPFCARYLRANRAFHPTGSSILFRVTVEQMPRQESRIALRTERDALDMPLIDLDWKIDEASIETIAVFVERAREELLRAGIADIKIDPRLSARDPAFLADASDTYHQMGVARMGFDPSDGVVDSNLRVFGTDNLYVSGAAVFPSTGFANCTLTAIALGLRLCDWLVSQKASYAHAA